ncbi:MAG TPA: phosphoribosyltransferase family protein [Thermoanaerobaculia bacterium]|nr:phosphoribosyltransferase family protein [Thermoanaerobaculia bacterium]
MSEKDLQPGASIAPLFDEEALRYSIAELGRRLAADLGGEDPLLVAILGGSVIFLADLVRAIDRPVRFELVHVEDSGDDTGGLGVRKIQYPIPIELAGQTVVVLKDVVATGVIESYLEQQLRDHGAHAVRFVALIDMPAERKTAFEVDYRAFSTERHGTLVGYGLKHAGRYGNLPYIGLLPPEA